MQDFLHPQYTGSHQVPVVYGFGGLGFRALGLGSVPLSEEPTWLSSSRCSQPSNLHQEQSHKPKECCLQEGYEECTLRKCLDGPLPRTCMKPVQSKQGFGYTLLEDDIIYIYTHIYIWIRIHRYIPTYLPTYLHAYIHTYIHTCMHTCVHTYRYICKRYTEEYLDGSGGYLAHVRFFFFYRRQIRSTSQGSKKLPGGL